MVNNRNAFFDNAKFILIFLVVLGHVISPYRGNEEWLGAIYHFIYIFHMPAFILLAGYFSQNFQKKKYYTKIVTQLLFPYLILQTVYTVYYNNLYSNTDFTLQYFTPRWAMWFLLSMIAWKLLLPLFTKLRPAYAITLSIIIGISAGFIEVPDRFLSLDRTFNFFPFFLIGYYLFNTSAFEEIKKKKWLVPAVGTLIISFTVVYFILGNIVGASILYGTYTSSSMIDIVIRLVMYTISLLITFSFFTVVPIKERFYTAIGQRSFYVYILHGFIIKWVFETNFGQSIQSVFDYLLLFLLSIFVTWFTGNKLIVFLVSKPFQALRKSM
ncbi:MULTISPECIES: acyltransferase family protein [Bacillus]|uniref:acyltransferase family protein n=1 Tax=Bacillus TaxID=1386 RepID=UPI000BB9807F|nr:MULTISPECIES: acyltransferase family protein [Bacillus]